MCFTLLAIGHLGQSARTSTNSAALCQTKGYNYILIGNGVSYKLWTCKCMQMMECSGVFQFVYKRTYLSLVVLITLLIHARNWSKIRTYMQTCDIRNEGKNVNCSLAVWILTHAILSSWRISPQFLVWYMKKWLSIYGLVERLSGLQANSTFNLQWERYMEITVMHPGHFFLKLLVS